MNNITHIARYVLTACTLFVAIGIATVADAAGQSRRHQRGG